MLLGLSLSWLLCYVLTAAGALPVSLAAYGHLARTDTRGAVLSQAPWVRLPYPGTCLPFPSPAPARTSTCDCQEEMECQKSGGNPQAFLLLFFTWAKPS